jgi:hypothetical protein
MLSMKNYSLIMTAVAVSALCLTAQANTVNITGGNSSVLTVNSTVNYLVGPNEYQYDYEVTVPAGNYMHSFSVFFPTTAAGVNSPYEPVGSIADISNPFNVNYTFTTPPEAGPGGTYDFGFFSPLPPEIGSAGALDSTVWPETSGVLVPAVPDGGLTLAMLGSTLIGVSALRSKFGSKRA